MSYCRFGEADVYLYRCSYGGIECCGCRSLDTFDEAIAHVREHVARGHWVPPDVIPALERDKRLGISLAPVERE